MKNKTKLAFELLEQEMETLGREELGRFLGGSGGYGYSSSGGYGYTDCVIMAFDYIDGSSDNYHMYQGSMVVNLGYNTWSTDSDGNTLGVKTEDISTVGSYGGLQVTELTSYTGITASGTTESGAKIMMTFNNGSGQDHAVVLTGTSSDYSILYYYDPQNNTYGTVTNGSFSALYAVSK